MKHDAIVGIDYSLSCPAICCYLPHLGPFSFTACRLYFLTDIKKRLASAATLTNVYGCLHAPYNTSQERYNNISWWAMGCISNYTPIDIMLEDYAFAAKGHRLFQLVENTQQLKHAIWTTQKKEARSIAPTAVKKFATGKGNASKDDMLKQFVSDSEIDLSHILGTKDTLDSSPTSDLIDAFYICKFALSHKN